jgi:hypothetical protein
VSEQEIDTAAIRRSFGSYILAGGVTLGQLCDALEDERQLSHDIGVSNDAAIERAEQAEAERDALKAAVERVRGLCERFEQSHGGPVAIRPDLIRAALKGEE